MRNIHEELQKKESCRLKHHEIEGCGLDISNLGSKVQKKIIKAYKNGKGVVISRADVFGEGFAQKGGGFSQQGQGIFGKHGDRVMKKAGVKKLAYRAGDALKPVAHESIQKAGHALSKVKGMEGVAPRMAEYASRYIEDPHAEQRKIREMMQDQQGEGIFGKKADRAFKKAGIKKILYRAGDAVKPMVQESLSTAGSSLAGVPGFQWAPIATSYANRYIEDPDAEQKRWRDLAGGSVSGPPGYEPPFIPWRGFYT